MLIPYVEIFSGRRQLPITEIIVGPGPLQRRCAAGVVAVPPHPQPRCRRQAVGNPAGEVG